MGYDDIGNLTSIADPLGHAVHLTYNSVDFPSDVEDALGRLVEEHYADGSVITTTYDAFDRPVHISRGDCYIAYTYDDAGRTVRTETPEATVDYTYDAGGRAGGAPGWRSMWMDSFSTTLLIPMMQQII